MIALLNDEQIKNCAILLLEEYKNKLAEQGVQASGALIQTAKQHISVEGTNFIVYFELQDYWKFTEFGVNGTDVKRGSPFSFRNKMPPVDKILDWLRVKPILPGTKNQAFAIAKSIQKKGIVPRKCLTAIEVEQQYIVDMIANRIVAIIQNKLLNEF